MLLSVTCVCAGDDNSINGIDEDGIYLENGGNAFLQEDNTITSSNEWYVDGNKIEDGNGSADNPFNNLKSSIDQSKEGDTIHIAPGTYKGSGLNVNLSIDKGLNLVNSGAGDVILDGESKYRIFNVSAQSLNVTGLTFTHGYCEDYGGAIYFANGLSDSRIDADFIENNARLGGAIYFDGIMNNNVFTGSYIRNEVLSNGGAMLVTGIATNNLFSADFRENKGKGYYGGAIHFTNQTSHNTFLGNFTGNVIVEGSGAGIVFDWDVNDTVFLANFSNNRVHEFPSAAFEVYGTSCNNTFGGYFENNVESAVLLSKCIDCTFNATFVNNSARHGGILSLEQSINNYINCTFINNRGQRGTALNIIMNVINTTIDGLFVNNTSTRLGGAIAIYPYIETMNYTIENVTIKGVFINNTAASYGGAVYLVSRSGVLFNGSVFESNSAENGGAIYLNAPDVVANSCVFVNNNAGNNGGAIYSHEALDMIDCRFENNNAGKSGGAVLIASNLSDAQIKSTFINNHASNGGAIFFNGTGRVGNIKFINNSAAEGGAIFTNGNLTVENAAFKDNRADDGTNQISLNATVGTVTLSNVTPEEIGPYKIADLRIVDIAVEDMVRITSDVVWKGNPVNEGNTSIIIDSKKYSAKVENGIAVIEIPNLDAGLYSANVTFHRGQYYNNPSQLVTFNVTKKDTKLITPSRVISVTDGVNGYEYQFILKDVDGNALAGKEVSVSFNGKNQTVITDDMGWGTATLYANSEGAYNVLITFAGDCMYSPISQNGSVKLVKEKTSFIAPDRAVYVQQMSRGYTYSAILKDVNGKALANKKVLFIFNGQKQVTYTDENGWATVKLTAVNAGTQSVIIRFAGDRYYRETETTRTINVVREASQLTVDDYVFKSTDKVKKITAKLESKSNAPVNDAKLTLTVDGISYTATTNESGIAVFSIDLDKIGIFNALTEFETSRFFRATSTTSKISIY